MCYRNNVQSTVSHYVERTKPILLANRIINYKTPALQGANLHTHPSSLHWCPSAQPGCPCLAAGFLVLICFWFFGWWRGVLIVNGVALLAHQQTHLVSVN